MLKTEQVSQNEILSSPKIKMKEKTKLKTIEEIVLQSQIQVEGEFIIHFRHMLCSISYAISNSLFVKCYVLKFASFESNRINYSRMAFQNNNYDRV